MIDSDILPDKTPDSPEKKEIFRLIDENRKRRILLAKEFSSYGANVLLIRPELCFPSDRSPFEFSEENGISLLTVRINSKRRGKLLPLKESLLFSGALFDNSSCLSGIFLPDAVILGGSFCFCAGSGTKIAEESGAVLVSELSSFPKDILPRAGICFGTSPMLAVLKKSSYTAAEQSDAVLGFSPEIKKRFSGAHGFLPMDIPCTENKKEPSSDDFSLYEKLFAFKEGGTFVLTCPVFSKNDPSVEKLISVCGGFDGKFALVLLSADIDMRSYKRMVSEKGITNVFFLEGAKKQALPFILSASDGIFLYENKFIKGSAPCQPDYFSVFSSGRPVVAEAEYWTDFFRSSGGSIITKPRNKESLRLGIKALMDMSSSDRDILGNANREFFEKHSFENFAKEYFLLLDNLVKQKENRK